MRTIHKYPLSITDRQDLILPFGAEILHVGVQQVGAIDSVFVWAMVEDEQPSHMKREIFCRGTGHEIPPDIYWRHIGTVMMHEGNLVFHFFEEA